MAFHLDPETNELVIDGWEGGISHSPYQGIANMRNVNTQYYPGVAYLNYRKQAATLGNTASIALDTSAYVGETSFGADGTNHTLTGSYTCSGTNRFLVVQTAQTAGAVNSVTYGGTSMTKLTDALDSNNIGQTLWYLANPSSGANNIVATSSAASFKAISYDNSAHISSVSSGTNYSYTVGATASFLSVSVFMQATQTVTAITYNGVSLGAAIASVVQPTANRTLYLFGLANPATGANNLNITSSDGSNMDVEVISYVNVASAEANNTGTGTSTSFSPSVTTVTANAWVMAAAVASDNLTAGSSTTIRIGSGTGTCIADSNAAFATPGSHSLNLNIASSQTYAWVCISLKPTANTYLMLANAASYTNVQQYRSVNVSTSNTTIPASSQSLSVTTTLPFCYSVLAVSAVPNTTITAGANTTIRQNNTQSSNQLALADSNAIIPTPTSNTLSLNFSGSVADTTAIMLAMSPALPNGMGNPVQKAQSPAGLNYILDSNGNVWKQNAVNSSTFSALQNGSGRLKNGAGGLAYWNNYLIVFGSGVIEFCGKGTNDSDITSGNWNVNSGSFYTGSQNIKFNPQTFQLTAAPSGATYTGGTLANTNVYPSGTSANWGYPTNSNATIVTSTGQVITGCTVTNGSSTVSCPSTSISGSPSTLVFISSPELIVVAGSSPVISAGNQIVFATTGTLPSPLVAGTTYYALGTPVANVGGSGIGGFQISATSGGSPITLNTYGDMTEGTGTDNTFSVVSYVSLPMGNITNLNFTAIIAANATSGTISTYTTPNGLACTGAWVLPTGTYNLIDANGNNILTVFTNGSVTASFVSPIAQAIPVGNCAINVLNPLSSSYRTYVSKVDGNVYWINGQGMGTFQISTNNSFFNPANSAVFSVSHSFFTLSTGSNYGYENIVDMTDLQSQMIVAGNANIYTWDYVSSFTGAPVPVGSGIKKIINLLNNIYILSGQKGNIYVSNGSYAQLLMKIPDYIAGVIDPVWTYGDIMTHRAKVYFQAMAQDTSGNNLLAGTFLIIVSPSLLGEVASGITMDSQNSYGLIPASGATGAGLLIDNEPSANGQDSYYSAYSTSATTGGIDFNDTTVWQNNEAVIETDMIPLGSILNKKTLGQIMFKLDRPMASTESISLYYRSTLTDAYTLIGTTSGTGGGVISNYQQSDVWQNQWVQFKITFSGASSSPSFLPLREIRVQQL